jgi:phosphoglycolate phosphatase
LKILKQTLLFDLDGTLTDSSEGIMNGIRYAIKKLKVEMLADDTLRLFIGPPLEESMRVYLNLDAKRAKQAVAFYREYYKEQGLNELQLYPGIAQVLATLKHDYHLNIATSKPEVFAKQILKNNDLAQYFDGIYGANLEGTRVKKGDVIAYALASIKEYGDVVMIGDREHDMIGAAEHHLGRLGVLYGFGTAAELEEAGAQVLVNTPTEIPAGVRTVFAQQNH